MRAFAIAIALLLMAPAAALAKTTQDITFESTGTAAAPGAVAGAGEPGTFEDIPFSIAADDADGSATIEVTWVNPSDDWDVYVYRKNAAGELETVASGTSAPPGTSEVAAINSQATPVDPGDYVIRVQNYTASNPTFSGTVKFTEYVIPNARPTASFKAPKKAKAGKRVKFDASASKDSDGQILNYSWDLDGDGSIESDGGTDPTLMPTFGVGVHHVALRVTDDKGKRAYATRTIRVKAPRVRRRGNR